MHSATSQKLRQANRVIDQGAVYIGLDQALANTGVAIYQNNSVSLLTLKTDEQEENYYHRLATLKRWVEQLIKKFQPLDIYLEAVYFNRETSINHIPIEVHAVLKTMLYEYGYNTPSLDCNSKRCTSWPSLTGVALKTGAKRILIQRGIRINNHENDAMGVLFGGMILSGLITREAIWQCEIKKKLVKSTPILDLE